jgi:uncharacterized protein involved in response to NO
MQPSLPLPGTVREVRERTRWSIGAKGFRPFFFLASLFAVVSVPLWLLALAGRLDPSGYLDAATWHAHEMVFGFAVAVITGFLLTAVGNWTKRETIVDAPLLGLAALWILGRVAMAFSAILPRWLPAAADLAFLPAVVIVLAPPLVAARNKKNFVMLAMLALIFATNVVIHLGALGVVSAWRRRAMLTAVDLIVLIIVVIAGRVMPMFTRNATGVQTVRGAPVLDVLAVASVALVVVLDAAAPESRLGAIAAGLAGALTLARTARWGARHSLRDPLLWVLHLGYLWIPLGFVLRAISAFAPAVPRSAAMHALTAGAIGTMTLGMMSRVALGHTGRPLGASRPVVVSFALVTLAAAVRVLAPLASPSAYLTWLVVAGCSWTAAFAIHLRVYAPILFAARVDGKAG